MSWIRTAMNRAVDKDNLRRTVRSYADSVVVHAGNAVAGGARIIQDRIGFRNVQGFKHNVKRLEEVSVSCRGVERVQLLRRWLVALKQVERSSSSSPSICDDETDNSAEEHPSFDSPTEPTLVRYFDSYGDEPRNFRDVFLYSQALEGITLSMILEAPSQEEASLLLEIYMLCLTGGNEVHNAILGKVQALAEAFSGYQDEVLIKREELLQFAQAAISGLKINANLARIDAEVCSIKEKLGKTKVHLQHSSDEGSETTYKNTTTETPEDQEQALVEIRLFFNLEALLLRKKSLGNGDSPRTHDDKMYKLKILLESLANSTSKAESRISDHRSQKEEALSFRVVKANEVHQAEKDLVAEIKKLERKRDELEDELKRVNTSLVAARMRLHNTKEERDHFDEASNQIFVHLKTKEDELLKSIASCRAEAEIVDTWIKFLEDTWLLQTSYAEQKEEQVMNDLERWGNHFVSLVIHLLTSYKGKLSQSITRIRELAEKLSEIQGSKTLLGEDDETSKVINPKKDLQVEYLDVKAKFLTTMSIADTIKKQFYVPTEGIVRKDDQMIKELFDAIEKIRDEFESIERPTLEIETTAAQKSVTPFDARDNIASPLSISTMSKMTPETSKHKKGGSLIEEKKITHETESEVLIELDSEFEADDINDWEFDALEKD